jgi:Kef-type K+ transport system membrane component KefB
MILISDLDFSLPLTNPVIVFSLVLFIILFAPILFNRIKIPHIIGLIAAGIIIGPYGLNLLLRDSSIVLFGTVGLLYIMFTAALEIDMEEFRKNSFKSFIFGLYTFAVPMILGTVIVHYLLAFSIPTSILVSSMFATHTLLAYPIASKFGLARTRAVTLTIGGTIITDILALLVLAAVVGTTKGEIGSAFWIRLAVSSFIFGCIVFFLFPLVARWFFKEFDDSISQYIFVLAMVFLGSFLAEVAGLEAIIGAFLSGLVLNRFIPHSSVLMNRIEFVGNAFFIPFFLISVGMLVDVRVLFNGWGALQVAGVMIVLAVISKFIAAWLTQKTFSLSSLERQMIYGLSNARVGATLAVVLVGYNIILGETDAGEPIRLLSEDVLNGTILMILVTCTISSFVVERASRAIALKEENKPDIKDNNDKILISLAYPETVAELVDFGLMLKPKASNIPIYALHVVSDDSSDGKTHGNGKKMMDKALKHAIATNNIINPLTRFDANICNGIIYTIKEQNITDLIVGLHHGADQHNFLGSTTESILKKTSETIFIYNSIQPFNTLKRMIVAVTPKAHFEPGFIHWWNKLYTAAKESGLPIVFYAHSDTVIELEKQHAETATSVKTEFNHFNHWEDFLALRSEIKPDDLFVIVSSRKGLVSYNTHLDRLPYYLTNYFKSNSYILLYPRQLEDGLLFEDIQHVDPNLIETITKVDVLNKATNYIKHLFQGDKSKKS